MMGINKWRLFCFLFVCFPPTSICVFVATGFCWERRSSPCSLQALNTQWTPYPSQLRPKPNPLPFSRFYPLSSTFLLEFPTQHYLFFCPFFWLIFVTISFEMKMISVVPFPKTRCYILKTQTVMRYRPSTGITHTNKKDQHSISVPFM